jgi:predicted porin
LEKIEMKKTLVAVAAMAAVTGAMADATIYGVIDQAYESKKATSGTTTTKTTKINGTLNGGSALGFTGSDDLGGGMKAYFQHEFGMATEQNDAVTNRFSYVGLSGGFGDVKIGKMYNFAFFNSIANDPLGFSGTSGYAGLGFGGGAASTSNMIAYTLPSIASGVGIQVGKAMGEAATTAAAPTKTGDSTSWGVTYAAGALYAGATGETVIATATTKNKHSTTTITYDLGMAKVGYSAGKTATGTDYTKYNVVSITVPLSTSAAVAYSSGDSKNKTGTAAEATTKISQFGGSYSLSKRTMAYLNQGKQTVSGSTTTQNIYAIGIRHAF